MIFDLVKHFSQSNSSQRKKAFCNMNNGRPPTGRPTGGRLLPRRERRSSIPEMKVLSDKKFSHRVVMQESAGRSHVAGLEEPTRCPLLPTHRRPGPMLTNALPRKTNAAVHCCKLPPLPHTLNFLSPEYPATHADENIKMVSAVTNNYNMGVASDGHPQKVFPLLVEESNMAASSLKNIKKKDVPPVKGSRKAVQQSTTELINNDKKADAAVHCCKLPLLNNDIEDVSDGHLQTLSPLLVEESIKTQDLKKKDVPLVKGSQKAVEQSTELINNEKEAQTNKTPFPPASSQDVSTRKPQPPSKLPVRKTIGQRTLNKKMAEVAANALQVLNVEVIADVSADGKTPDAKIAEDLGIVATCEKKKDLKKKDVPQVKGSQKAVEPSTELINNEKEAQTKKTVFQPASNQDVGTRKPQPPSKIPVRKTIGQHTLTKKMVEAATCSFGDSVATRMVPRSASRSKPEEIRERRRAGKHSERPLLLQRSRFKAKLPGSRRVSQSPTLLLITEVDECSPSNSKASSPAETESSFSATIQPRPPAGPCPPRRPNNRLTRPRSQSMFGFRAYDDETEEDEQDRQMLEAMLSPWFRSKSRGS
ncbi:uncharacterized protein LOC121680082 isoform X3 [Alosa sapidissima]|uniref:uncharacterized protein LOC121680082 isoform X3 n=1 Tax=Alosa sapidissima TaxID=34773 RepID=UPI001C09FB3E|nr:uncharacterized protein LOC121680082 isoform X3 [Alosa sapidissima]